MLVIKKKQIKPILQHGLSQQQKLVVKKKIPTFFRSKIRSRHPSHNVLRTHLPLLPFRSVVRLGSMTEVPDTIENGGKRVECNTIQAVKNSASKLLMKQCFNTAGVKTANWVRTVGDLSALTNNFELAFVAKNIYGSRGKGNTLIKNKAEYEQWLKGRDVNHYIFELFHNYALEYRLHITEDGCFYTCRKGLKADAPESEKWRRHDDICVWYLEDGDNFLKPKSWNDIINDCVKALKAIGADVLSFDVRVQSEKNNKGKVREYQDYILIECNSASSMDNGKDEISVCASKYLEEIPKILRSKYNGI